MSFHALENNLSLFAHRRSIPLIDPFRDAARVASIRKRCGFYDQEPPYDMYHARETVFPDVLVTVEALPLGVLAQAEVGAGRRVIILNRAEPESMRRFGMAHEFGHLCIDLVDVGDVQHRECRRNLRSGISSDTELRCDHFGAELVVPFAVLDRYAPAILFPSEKKPDLCQAFGDAIARLAAKFGVSESLIEWRLRDLKLLRQSSFFRP